MTAIFDSWLAGGERARLENLDDDKRARQQRLDQQKQQLIDLQSQSLRQSNQKQLTESQGRKFAGLASRFHSLNEAGDFKGALAVSKKMSGLHPSFEDPHSQYSGFIDSGDFKGARAMSSRLFNMLVETGGIKDPSSAGGAGQSTANIQDHRYYVKLKKTDPEAARQFGMDVGLVSREGRELSGHMQKNLTKYTDAAVAAQNLGGEFEYLASEYERLDPVAGSAGKAYDFMKTATGSEDAVSEIRRKYMKIRASQVVKNLPPGAASEKDVALALSGFPEPDANSKHMASFMRGLAKLQGFDDQFNSFKADYVSEKGHERGMLKAWRDRAPEKVDLSDEDLLKKYGG